MTEQQLIDEGYMEGKKSFQYWVKEIYNSFDFEKVHKAMIATEWYWYLGKDESENDNMGIPSLNTIKNHAYYLLKSAYDSSHQTGTGGFTAGWEDGCLYLVFTLQEA